MALLLGGLAIAVVAVIIVIGAFTAVTAAVKDTLKDEGEL